MFDMVRRLKLEQFTARWFDDSFCLNDKETQALGAVDWHHDPTASPKKRKVYCHGSVYVLCHLQIG